MSGKAKKVREKKETTLFLAVIPILAMIVLLEWDMRLWA